MNDKNPIEFNAGFLEQTAFLSEEESRALMEQCRGICFDDFVKNDQTKVIEKLCFDFVYTSAQIEGNTYTKAEAETLFETQKPIGSKTINDAIMLLNIKEALEYVLAQKPPLNKHSIREIHQILSSNLLPKVAQGAVRKIPVFIGSSAYRPINNPIELDCKMDLLLQKAEQIANPFDKAIYLHLNLAYLQYFQDCNKRLARMIQNLALVSEGYPFLAYDSNDSSIISQYKESIIAYYERGEAKPYTNLFIKEYQNNLELLKSVKKYLVCENTKTSTQNKITKRSR